MYVSGLEDRVGRTDVFKVAGEIKDYKKTLRWAAVTTVCILTFLQMLVTFAFVSSCDCCNFATNNDIVCSV